MSMTTRRSGLGRGLDALIPTHAEPERLDFAEIPVDSIKPNPNQPRARFSDEAIASLAESIQAVGVLQPVAVMRQEDGGYVLIAGERRVRAARRLGLETIPAMIRTVDDRGSLTEALIENVQREDLSPLEEAAAYQQLLEDFGMTHEDVGSKVGKSRSAITNTIRLLQLPASIQGMLERGELSPGHARALLGIEDRAYAEHIAGRAVEEGWSVRQVEEAARVRKPTERPPVLREIRPVEIIELEQRLAERFGTKVAISYKNRKGKVEIPFKSLEELERLYRLFLV
jgi:ParB family transcriptional regulator, chromosome partitioning protein